MFLQYDGSVGRVGRLQRGLLLPVGVNFCDATNLPNRLVLPGAESQHDSIARIALLRVERHECADRVRRWFILQPDWSERCLGSLQRRILLQRGFVDCDAVLVPEPHLLPDR